MIKTWNVKEQLHVYSTDNAEQSWLNGIRANYNG